MSSWKKINIKFIIKFIGFLLIFEGFFMLTGLGFSIYYGNDIYPLLISGLFTSCFGFFLWVINKNYKNKDTGKREGYITVSLTWIVMSLFGTLPFLLSKSIPNFTNAFFETISGFTTTGASILNNIEAVPRDILFWRSMTHWIGGMGIIVLSIAILPILGIGGMQLFAAEVPGPTKDRLHPRIRETAKRLWGIYILLTFIETLLLMYGGMDFFNAICHAFGTMATGGFSTQNASIANYSPFIQYVIIVFMILAGTNFTLHYFALRGKIIKIWRNEEFRYYIYLIFACTIIIAVCLFLFNNTSGEESFRSSLFQVVSIITTTGYVTTDYLSWPVFLWFFLFLLMFTGGCAGSTGGGVKIVRDLLLFKNSSLELKRLVHPSAIIPVRLNKKVIPQNIIFNVLAFFLIYMLLFAFGTLFMTILGLDFKSAMGSVAATLGNIGPAIGSVGPIDNYANIPVIGKWFLSFLMLLGRLELFTVLILFSPAFWKK